MASLCISYIHVSCRIDQSVFMEIYFTQFVHKLGINTFIQMRHMINSEDREKMRVGGPISISF